MRFELIKSKLGSKDTVIVVDKNSNSKIEIALKGATLLKYELPFKNEMLNIIDGFQTEEELELGKGARSWIMAPFSNRIKDGVYTFDGKTYQMEIIPPRNQVIHGFTSYVEFQVIDFKANESSSTVTFFTDCLRPNKWKGYPFSVDVYVKYNFTGDKLSIEVEGRNVGNEPAPFGTGWHPYFKTSENGIEDLILTIDSSTVIEVDEKLIPLQGEAAYQSIEKYPELDFRPILSELKRKIDKRVLDNCYADLAKDANGYSFSTIYDPTRNLRIKIFQKGGMTLVFTGDTLSERQRYSIAVEPVQFMTNAFNRPELSDKIKILPGKSSAFQFGIEIK